MRISDWSSDVCSSDLYSAGLKRAGFEWNAAALDGWLEDPQAMIPGSYMVFRGIDDAQARADLIAFLEIAGRPGGGEKAVAEGLLPAAWLSAGAPELIRHAPPSSEERRGGEEGVGTGRLRW